MVPMKSSEPLSPLLLLCGILFSLTWRQGESTPLNTQKQSSSSLSPTIQASRQYPGTPGSIIPGSHDLDKRSAPMEVYPTWNLIDPSSPSSSSFIGSSSSSSPSSSSLVSSSSSQVNTLNDDYESEFEPSFDLAPSSDLGLVKRDPGARYAFGLGKRGSPLDHYSFGIGKRIPEMSRYLTSGSKRLQNRFQFGLGKKSRYSFGLGKRDLYEYIKRRYSFGIGKRSPAQRYSFGLG